MANWTYTPATDTLVQINESIDFLDLYSEDLAGTKTLNDAEDVEWGKLSNGGMTDWDDADTPTGWVNSTTTANSKITEVDPDEGYGGAGATGGAVNIWTDNNTPTIIRQNDVLTIGKSYRLTLDLKVRNSGAIKIGQEAASNSITSSLSTVADNHTFDFVSAGNDIVFTRTGTDVDITLDNISIVEIDALSPCDDGQLKLTISTSADRAGSTMNIYGYDSAMNGIEELNIDISGANSTAVETGLSFAKIDHFTITGMTAGDTYTITQPRWGVCQPQFGPNILTNGTMTLWDDANTPTGWTASTQTANSATEEVDPDEGHGGAGVAGGAINIWTDDNSSAGAKQDDVLIVGKSYRATFGITNSVDGQIVLTDILWNVEYSSRVSAVGTYTVDFVAQYTGIALYRTGGPDVDITLDNISIHKIIPQWLIKANIEFGDDSTASSFQSNNEEVYFADGFTFKVTSNATLNSGTLVDDYGTEGSMWSVGPDATWDVIAASETGTFNFYASMLKARTDEQVVWNDGTVDIRNAILSHYTTASSTSNYVINVGVDSLILHNVQFNNTEWVGISKTPNEMSNVHVHSSRFGMFVGRNTTLTDALSTSYSVSDYFVNGAYTLTLKNPQSPAMSPNIGDASGVLIEQYTTDIHVADTDGDDLESVDIVATYAHLVEGTDSQTWKCKADLAFQNAAAHKPITGTDYADYWELYDASGGKGGDWQEVYPYAANQAAWSPTPTTTDGLRVAGALSPDITGDFVNIGPQAAAGLYDPAQPDPDVYHKNINGQDWYLWHDSDGTENWYIANSIGFTGSYFWGLTYTVGDPTGSYVAKTSATGTATVTAISGLIPQQVIQYKAWRNTAEELEARVYKFTYSHTSYLEETKNNMIVSNSLDWEKEMAISTADLITTLTDLEVDTTKISGDATAADNAEKLFEGNGGFGPAYAGSHGPGVYLDDAAANTNTVNGTDGTWHTPVSTIAAAKTIADSLKVYRIYLMNNSAITLGATMEDYAFIGLGDIAANTINLGTRDVDNSYFENVLMSGEQGGTKRLMAHRCALSTLTELEAMAWECAIVGNLTVRQDSYFDKCWSAVAGNGTPTLDINSVADVNISWRHYSGGIQVDNAVATTTMSYETDGQLIVDASCTSLAITVRGNCTITDNGTTTSLTQSAAINQANVANWLKTSTGWTAGGTSSLATVVKIISAGVAGDASLTGSTTTMKDIDDNSSVFTYVPGSTGTIKEVTIT